MLITRQTLTITFWSAATLSMFTLQPHNCCRDANTCDWPPRRPYCQQKAPSFCARFHFFARPSPSCSILTFGRPSFADHPRTFFKFLGENTVPLFFGRLQHGLTFRRLPSQPSHFSLSVYFCYVPTVVYRYSLLWERILFCFRVASVSMCYLFLHVFIW